MIRLLVLLFWGFQPQPSAEFSTQDTYFDSLETICSADAPSELPFIDHLKRLKSPTLRKSKYFSFLETDFFKCQQVVNYPCYVVEEYFHPFSTDLKMIFPFHEFS